MSITLITGLPGAGKTLHLVGEILNDPRYLGRPMFIGGIRGLKTSFFKLPPLKDWTVQAQLPEMPDGVTGQVFDFPQNALIVLDEAQYTFPPRPATARPPAIVEAQTTHRHYGLDFIFLTQHPGLMDKAVRDLVDQHIHIKRVWGMNRAVIYRWDSCSHNLGNLKQSTKTLWKYPRRAFDQYESSQLHTTGGRRAPWIAFAVPVLVSAFIGAGWFAYGKISQRFEVTPEALAAQVEKPKVGLFAAGVPGPALPSGVTPPVDFSPSSYLPSDPTRPESAAAYQGMVSVQTVPRVAACVASRRECVCYTQQATRVDVPAEFCRDYAASGRFEPYQSASAPASLSPVSVPEDKPLSLVEQGGFRSGRMELGKTL
jgi:zona occludens toxin